MITFYIAMIIEVILIVGVGVYLSFKEKILEKEGGFAYGGRVMGAVAIGATVGLGPLGTPHVLGIPGMVLGQGEIAMWFVLGGVSAVTAVMLITGPLARKLEVNTAPEMMELMFGDFNKVLIIAAGIGGSFGGLALECQGMGAVISIGGNFEYTTGLLIAGVFIIIYVFLGGMKQMGIVNTVNAVLVYVGIIGALIYVSAFILKGDWSGVNNFYETAKNANGEDMSWMLSMVQNKELLWTVGVVSLLSQLFTHPCGGAFLQACISAKSVGTVRRAALVAIPVNGLFGLVIISIAMFGNSDIGNNLDILGLFLYSVPKWLGVVALMGFFGVILSTASIICMAMGTIIANDVYKRYYNKNATEKQQNTVNRVIIVVLVVASVMIATFVPSITGAANWSFSWGIPPFVFLFFGVFWKCSKQAFTVNIIFVWIVNSLWSLTPLPDLLGVPPQWQDINAILTTCLSFVVGAVLTAILPGEESLFSMMKKYTPAELRENRLVK
ncbi:MAG: sodium:solute symporter family protein [Clostridiales Family XIII bacterium]|nr:sodium:solute symporter family protein [Clostridiales Family XIII bacterium]